ncbi:hypothetical protein HQ865_18125 [Mucilaginibacter mali]|uniref:Uncharacterized protein n=1 Tax=Mucilaginibacter mali TaxID=2740462 RepID=A0A7D4UQ03_9SPHI|nr:hypothetical protein [Mucilaginibacter mali]QKJ31600.1 hypothetical protein HQ865_18125 [Mucilaginibacter mali]
MAKYLTIEQLRTNISLGKPVEQWLSHESKEDYTILKWLRIYKERDQTYSVNYIECYDDGDDDFIDIYEFSSLDPDELYFSNSFDSVGGALDFSVSNYSASLDKFVTGGMIQEEYILYRSLL